MTIKFSVSWLFQVTMLVALLLCTYTIEKRMAAEVNAAMQWAQAAQASADASSKYCTQLAIANSGRDKKTFELEVAFDIDFKECRFVPGLYCGYTPQGVVTPSPPKLTTILHPLPTLLLSYFGVPPVSYSYWEEVLQ